MSIFDTLYGATKEAKEGMKKPFVKKRYKRLFYAALDEVQQKIFDHEAMINKEREKFDECDVNVIIDKKIRIRHCQDLTEYLREEYLEVFGEQMKIEE